MQNMVQGTVVPDVSDNSKNGIVRKRSTTSNDSSFDEKEDSNDQSVPKQRTKNLTKISRSAALDEHIVQLIDSKVDSINDNFKAFLKEVRLIKEEIGELKPRQKRERAVKSDQTGNDEDFEEQRKNWQAEAQEMKKTLNWSPLDDIMVHSQAFKKAANNERQSLEPVKRVLNFLN
jgi:hypothetical protein